MARESILVVEDDKIIAMELRSRLQRWGFVVPATAATGEEAIRATLTHRPDLVLMDIWLQGPMDGIMAAERIHESLDTPIIYVTANADESTLERAKLTEPYGYVLKPFEELELRTTIEIALYKHRLESQLREKEQWLSTTLTSIGDAVIATDEKGIVTFVNPVALDLMKIGREDILGRDMGASFKIIDEATRNAATAPTGAALMKGAVHHPSNQILLVAHDGSELPIYYNVAPIRNEKGRHQGVVLVFRDVTARKRAERLQSALYEISEAANSPGDLDTLCAAVHTIVTELLPAKNFYLALCDPDRTTISFPYFVDERDQELGPKIYGPIPFGKGITEFLIVTGSTLLLQGDTLETLAATGEIAIMGTLPSYWLGAPLKTADGQTIGAVAAQSYDEGLSYTSQDKDVLEFVSTQIAMAIERKQTEQTLRESEERFRTIFARSAIGIGIVDIPTMAFLETNEAFQKMLGYAAEELRGRPSADVIHPTQRKEAVRLGAAFVAGNEDHRLVELRFLSKSGEAVVGRTTVSMIRNDVGVPLFGVMLVEDITDRIDAGERIRQQAALLDHAQDAICVRDLESKITYWNKGAERLYGWTSEEAIGQNEFDLLLKEALPDLGKAQKEVLTRGEWVGELTQKTRTSEEVVVQSHWTLVRDENGEPVSVLVINTNMTDRKKLEAQFLRAQRLESIGTLAGGIAHDLNNVLSPILLAAHLLRSRTSDPMMRKWIDTMEASAQRGAGILSQVLTFARGGSSGKKTVVQPRHLLKEMAKIATETFPRSIEISTDLSQELCTISGDPNQLHQVLMNLCVNARDAMPAGGSLVIKGENVVLDDVAARQIIDAEPGRYVVFSVIDTGTGIPGHVLEKLFEPFFTTKEPGHGTGLGLSTVHAIVKSHGGFVRVASTVGKGSEFRIFLPAHNVPELPAVAEDDSNLHGHGEQILVIDDERVILSVTEEILGASGYRAVTATCGRDGIEIYARQPGAIDLVLVDMMMPQMDGLTTIQGLRRINPNVKILAMSGIPQQGNEGAFTGTSERFIPKPFTATTLLKALKELFVKGKGEDKGVAA